MSTITRSSAKAKRARSINSGDIEMPTNMCQVCTIQEISRETLKILYKLCQFTFEHYIQSGPWQIYGKHLTDSGRSILIFEKESEAEKGFVGFSNPIAADTLIHLFAEGMPVEDLLSLRA